MKMKPLFREKIKVSLLFLLLPVFLPAQNTDYYKWNLQGKVNTIKETSYRVIEKNGEIVKDGAEYYFINEFNDAGNKTVDTKYGIDGKILKNYTYKYDDKNRRIEEVQYINDKELLRTIGYVYDSQGLLIEDESFGSNGETETLI